MPGNQYEMAIVGAGPIGLELAVALKRLGISYVHFDARQIGYTISWYAPQTRFFSSNERIAIAGVPLFTPEQNKATREQYLTYLRTVVEQYDLHINTYEPVLDIRPVGEGFELVTHPSSGERVWFARRIVLATGGTDRPRLLNIPGEDLPHASHYFDDPHKYFRKQLLIVGGKNSAVEAALRCHNAGANVTLSYRGPSFPEAHIKYWLMPELRSLVKSGRISAYFNSRPVEITPSNVRLRIDGERGAEAAEFDVPADFVLMMTGYEQDMTLLLRAGVELHGPTRQPVYDPNTMMSNVHGLYVAGTCVGGTQEKFTIFIENCHEHIEKIMQSAFGRSTNVTQMPMDLPES